MSTTDRTPMSGRWRGRATRSAEMPDAGSLGPGVGRATGENEPGSVRAVGQGLAPHARIR